MHVRINGRELVALIADEAKRRAGGEDCRIASMVVIDEDGHLHAVADCEASVVAVTVEHTRHRDRLKACCAGPDGPCAEHLTDPASRVAKIAPGE